MSQRQRATQHQLVHQAYIFTETEEYAAQTLTQMKTRLNVLNEVYGRFMDVHLDIVAEVRDEAQMDQENELVQNVQELYLNTVSIYEQRIQNLERNDDRIQEQRAERAQSLTNSRNTQRIVLERAATFAQSPDFDEQNLDQLIERRSLLVKAYEDFQSTHRRLTEREVEEQEIEASMDYAQQVQEIYLQVIGKIDQKMRLLEQPGNALRAGDAVGPNRTCRNIRDLQLGTIKPEGFNGDYANWNTWRAVYDGLVHREERLSNTEKFHYLKKCLSGAAERVLRGWEVVGDNYEEAYNTLVEVYDNKYRIIMAQLDALLKMPKVSLESHEGLRTMVDTMNSATRQLRVLGSPVEHWDHILVYLLLSRMPPRTLTQWNTAHDLMEMPSLDDVLKFLNTRARGIINLGAEYHVQNTKDKSDAQSTGTKPKEQTNERQTNQLKCFKCQGNHPIYRCTELLSKSVSERIKIVKGLKRCLNCFASGHEAGSTSCKASTCKACKTQYHNTVLCPKGSATIASVSTSDELEQDFQ